MKRYFSGLLILSQILSAGAQNLDWVRQMKGSSYDEGFAIATDAFGNIYTTGYFEGYVDFDPGEGTYFLTSSGQNDMFVSKLDHSGNFVWAVKAGGADYDFGSAISIDTLGNVYVTGYFGGTADFDPGPAAYNLSSFGGWDVFVMKLDKNGDFVWSKQIGGMAIESGRDLVLDASEGIFLTGRFQEIVDFDPGPGIYNLTSDGDFDVFIVKLDFDGNFIWAKKVGGEGDDYVSSIARDNSGNLVLGGEFDGNCDFDPDTSSHNLTSAGDYDLFLLKLTGDGDFIWVNQLGALDWDFCTALDVDIFNNIVFTGIFSDTVDFDPGVGIFQLAAVEEASDIFVSKVNADGNLLWAKQIAGTFIDYCYSICSDVGNKVYVSGQFSGTTDFDPTDGTYTLTTIGGNDGFIACLDSSGNLDWVAQFGGTSFEYCYAVEVDISGSVVSTGKFGGATDFDPGAGTHFLTSVDGGDIFIHKMSPIVSSDFIPNTDNNITIFPNPTNSTASIMSKAMLNNARVRVLNTTGQVVFEKANQQGENITIDIGALPLGIYYLEILEGATHFGKKIIKN